MTVEAGRGVGGRRVGGVGMGMGDGRLQVLGQGRGASVWNQAGFPPRVSGSVGAMQRRLWVFQGKRTAHANIWR